MQSQQHSHLLWGVIPRKMVVVSLDHRETTVICNNLEPIKIKNSQKYSDHFLLDINATTLWAKVSQLLKRQENAAGIWETIFGYQIVVLLRNSATKLEEKTVRESFEQITFSPKTIAFSRLQENLLGKLVPTAQSVCAVHFREEQAEVLLRSQGQTIAETLWFDSSLCSHESESSRERILQKWWWQLKHWISVHSRATVSDGEVSHILLTGLSPDQKYLVNSLKTAFGTTQILTPEEYTQTIAHCVFEIVAGGEGI